MKLPHAERLFKILADENRLKLLAALAEGERSVSEVLNLTGLPRPSRRFTCDPSARAGSCWRSVEGPSCSTGSSIHRS